MTKKQKKILLLAAVAVLLVAGVGGTVAYIVTHTDPVVNTFEATNVAVSVGNDGKITNTGNIDAYIRAAVVATWQDNSGNVYATAPAYTVSMGSNWEKNGDFYYYMNSVSPGAANATSALSASTDDAAPSDDYTFTVEILAQGIQATGVTGATGYTDVWTKAAGN